MTSIRWLLLVCLAFCSVYPGAHAALIESQGAFVPGAGVKSVGGLESQVAFGAGFASSVSISGSGSLAGQFGPIASIQNAPVVTDDRFNFSASLGDALEISFDDLVNLSGIVELDGEALSFYIEVSTGELKLNDQVTAAVVIGESESFVWELPDSGDLGDFVMSVTGLDAVALPSEESPLGIEDAASITFTVTAGDSSTVDESSSSDFGDAEVSVDSVSEDYTVTNETTVSSSSLALQRMNRETSTWSEADRRRGLMLFRIPPPRSGRLTISSIDLGGLNSDDFKLSGVSLPLVLDPGESETFTVTFSPQAPGDRLASVDFGRPGRPSGFFGFGVQGRGNRPPTGFDDEVVRPIGLEPLKIRLADLLANDRDIDGDMVRFGGFSTPVSMRGRAIELLNDEWMVYYPGEADEPQDDSFVYRVSDGRGATAPSVVYIREEAFGGTAGAIEATVFAAPGQAVTIRVRGIPGRSYQAQFTDQLNPPHTIWNNLGVPMAASLQNGSFQVTDPQPPAGQRIYRIIEAGQVQQPGPGQPGGGEQPGGGGQPGPPQQGPGQ